MRRHKKQITKTRLRNSLSPLGYFIEHLVGMFEKLPRENNLDHKSSRLSTRWLEAQPVITCKQSTPDRRIDKGYSWHLGPIQWLSRILSTELPRA
jgi:hypothetical protein